MDWARYLLLVTSYLLLVTSRLHILILQYHIINTYLYPIRSSLDLDLSIVNYLVYLSSRSLELSLNQSPEDVIPDPLIKFQ